MNGKGDKPRNCFSKQFKDNYEQINWGKISCEKVNRYPIHLEELILSLIGNASYPKNINDQSKFSDFDICPKNKERAKLFKKYDLDNSVKDMYVWEVTEMMYNYIPF